ncbi:MAG: radical SAM protein [Candidatus Woesearchaeota archaeon]
MTSRCNSVCTHCDVWKHQGNIKDELTLSEIKRMFSFFDRNIVWVSFTGGEPFVRDDMDEIITAITRLNKHLALLTLTTNGLEQGKVLDYIRRARGINDVNFAITFSLEGTEDIHNSIRKVDDAFERTINTIKRALHESSGASNIFLMIETVLDLSNTSSYNDFLESLSGRLDMNRLSFLVTYPHKGNLYGTANPDNILSRDDIDIIDNLKLLRLNKDNPWPVKVLQRKYLKHLFEYISTKKSPLPCRAARDSFFIASDGSVYPCIIWDKKIGNLRDVGMDLNKIIQKRSLIETRNKIIHKKCPGCWTPCEANHAIMHDMIRNPHHLCSDLMRQR